MPRDGKAEWIDVGCLVKSSSLRQVFSGLHVAGVIRIEDQHLSLPLYQTVSPDLRADFLTLLSQVYLQIHDGRLAEEHGHSRSLPLLDDSMVSRMQR